MRISLILSSRDVNKWKKQSSQITSSSEPAEGEEIRSLIEAPTNFSTEGSFPDVEKNQWYAKYICVAKVNGVVNGLGDGTFAPNKKITRAEAIKILLTAKGIIVTGEGEDIFADAPKGYWFSPFVDYSEKNEIVNGFEISGGKKEFRPHVSLTRAELAKLIVKVILEE